MADGILDAALRRDRAVVLAALLAVTASAWTYVLSLADASQPMTADMPGMAMATPSSAWNATGLGLTFAMWTAMMIGMMTPTAAPMILLYAQVGRRASAQGKPFAAASWFLAGYLLAWTGFAAVASAVQALLGGALLLTPGLSIAGNAAGGAVLVGAGLYQLSSLKYRCLAQCQSPLLFIQRHGGFRRDAAGALRLGARHGAYCVGCCWLLMGLLFVVGIMNFLWIAALSALVLLEKLLPARRLVSRALGVGLIAAGLFLLSAQVLSHQTLAGSRGNGCLTASSCRRSA